MPRLGRVTDLPPGYADGYEFAAPVVRMPTYLPWLLDELAAAGVAFRVRALTDLAAGPADVVVNATGLGARELAGDPALTGVRGQVVRVADPGLAGWTLDEDHPDGMVYVVPRGTDVVCGGTALDGDESTAPDPAEAERILARCRARRAGAGGRAGARARGRRPPGPPGGPAGARPATSCTATGTAAPASRCPGAAPTRWPGWWADPITAGCRVLPRPLPSAGAEATIRVCVPRGLWSRCCWSCCCPSGWSAGSGRGAASPRQPNG